jgi:pyruvate carboxylase
LKNVIIWLWKNIKTLEEAKLLAEKCGYPVMLKVAAGGGGRGRGMRIVRNEDELAMIFLYVYQRILPLFY